jgi:sugar phosphate isomerase/epimerase
VLHDLDIGISSGAYRDLSLGAALARIRSRAPAAEIRSFDGHSLLDPGNLAAAAGAGLPLTVHGPFRGVELGSLDEAERRRAIGIHRRQLHAAAHAGATLYVVHPDYHADPRPRERAVAAALARSFDDLYGLQAEYGLDIVAENMPGAGCSHFTAPGDLDLRGLGLLLDVGHAAISGTLEAFLADPRAPLRHVHLHDNLGPRDLADPHRALGSGVVDVPAVLAAAGVAGASLLLEVDCERDVVASERHLRALAGVC